MCSHQRKGVSMSDSEIYDKAIRVIDAWASMRPDKTFFRMSLEEIRRIIAPSGEARKTLAELEARTQETLAYRDRADKLTRRAILRIVNAVRGDPDEGEDGELLAAMGYLPH